MDNRCQHANYSRTSVARVNTDGSSTTAVSNTFFGPLKKSHSGRLRIIKGIFFLFYIENGMLCVLIRIASLRRF